MVSVVSVKLVYLWVWKTVDVLDDDLVCQNWVNSIDFSPPLFLNVYGSPKHGLSN
jgi:hypothetical protein